MRSIGFRLFVLSSTSFMIGCTGSTGSFQSSKDSISLAEVAKTAAGCNLQALGALANTPANKVDYGYCLVLGRAADPAGLALWSGLLSENVLSMRSFLTDLYSSTEFQAGQNIAQLSNGAFVNLMYSRFLLRAADSAGYTLFVNELNAGLTKVQVFQQFVDSDEFAERNPLLFNDGGIDQAMSQLFAGTASFRTVVNMQISSTPGGPPSGMDAGTQIIPVGGVWYMINREYDYTTPPSECHADFARIVVRSSVNHGQSWSAETVIAQPNLAAGECAIVDGKLYQDQQTSTWHLLAQVLSSSGVWTVNHYSLSSAVPNALFSADAANPVMSDAISAGLLASICGVGKSCPAGTNQLGTPEIAYKENGNYYVSFHAVNLNSAGTLLAYRILMKTPDFHNWVATAADLPNDAVWSSKDCQAWQVPWNPSTGCIGGGNAATLRTSRKMYMLIESADVSIACVAGQHWALGLARSPSFVASGSWESFANNPLINTGATSECSVQYQDLFTDGGVVYLAYWTLAPSPDSMDAQTYFHIMQLVPAQAASATANQVTNILTDLSVLTAFNHDCMTTGDASSIFCHSAAEHYCASQGYIGGIGPTEENLDSAVVACVGAGSATKIETTFTALGTYVPTCVSGDPGSPGCAAAIERYCRATGYAGMGYGSDYSGNTAIVTCMNAAVSTPTSATFSALNQYVPGCSAAAPESLACNAGIDQYCKARNYTSGFGVLEYSPTSAVFACVR